MKEIWKDITGYEEAYKISNYGNVYSKHVNRILSPETNNNGYVYIRLWKNNKRKTFVIHRLVGKYFLHNPNNFPELNHIDGNKLNNKVDNLEWCDRSFNIKHSYDNNLRELPKGEINGNSKLKEHEVIKILKLLNNGSSVKQLSKIYKVSWECINNIKLNKSWKHIDRNIKI